jgi:hypothetical protein
MLQETLLVLDPHLGKPALPRLSGKFLLHPALEAAWRIGFDISRG